MQDKKPTIGRVTSVETSHGRVHVNVQHDRPSLQDVLIPFMSLTPGSVVTPQEGDLVEIYHLDGGGTAARFAHSHPQYPMPDMQENEMVFRFDEDTEIRFYRDADDRYVARLSGDVKVEIESQGAASLLAGSDITVDGSSISLGQSGESLVTDVQTSKSDGYVTDISLVTTTKTTAE